MTAPTAPGPRGPLPPTPAGGGGGDFEPTLWDEIRDSRVAQGVIGGATAGFALWLIMSQVGHKNEVADVHNDLIATCTDETSSRELETCGQRLGLSPSEMAAEVGRFSIEATRLEPRDTDGDDTIAPGEGDIVVVTRPATTDVNKDGVVNQDDVEVVYTEERHHTVSEISVESARAAISGKKSEFWSRLDGFSRFWVRVGETIVGATATGASIGFRRPRFIWDRISDS